MGQLKDLNERLGGGNPLAHAGEYVCASCLGDDGLRDLIERETCEHFCTFCEAESTDPIAASLIEVLLYMNECLDREYDDAANWYSYDEGEYVGRVWTTMDVLERELGGGLPNDDGTLMDALCDGLGDRAWCPSRPYSLTEDQQLAFSWEAFCELIKYGRRYFFLREPPERELFSPLKLLEQLGICCERFDLVTTLPVHHTVYRARRQKQGERHETAGALGPPPRDKATVANRMSPPGIVMFYASDDEETAVREVAKDPESHSGRYAIGRFRTLREVRILDLTAIPEIPSIFEPVLDSLEYDPRPPLIFLNYFADELSKPIAGDSSAHIEYIPSQVVTEYFRTAFVHHGAPVAGIRYQSARLQNGSSVALFASQDNLEAVDDVIPHVSVRDRDPWIELVSREDREVTMQDLKRWEHEAPQSFGWRWT